MRNKTPEQNLKISWIMIGVGALLALIGAAITQDYRVNVFVVIGAMVIFVGIAYHLITVRCPYCGHSLAGYRPLPEICPKCNRKLNG